MSYSIHLSNDLLRYSKEHEADKQLAMESFYQDLHLITDISIDDLKRLNVQFELARGYSSLSLGKVIAKIKKDNSYGRVPYIKVKSGQCDKKTQRRIKTKLTQFVESLNDTLDKDKLASDRIAKINQWVEEHFKPNLVPLTDDVEYKIKVSKEYRKIYDGTGAYDDTSNPTGDVQTVIICHVKDRDYDEIFHCNLEFKDDHIELSDPKQQVYRTRGRSVITINEAAIQKKIQEMKDILEKWYPVMNAVEKSKTKYFEKC
jgi:hypothetical protein